MIDRELVLERFNELSPEGQKETIEILRGDVKLCRGPKQYPDYLREWGIDPAEVLEIYESARPRAVLVDHPVTRAPRAPDRFELFRAWWADVANRRSPATTADYRGACFRFFAQTAHDPLEVTAGQIKVFLKDLRTQHANLYRHALKDFFAFTIRRGVRAENPLDDVKRHPVGRQKIKRSLTEDELERLLIAAVYVGRYRRRWEGERMALLMLAQYYTGLRPGELIRLTTARIALDDAKPHIEVTETKTGADRRVPLSARALEVFRELARDRVGRICEVSETTYWTWVKRAAMVAGIPTDKARPYTFRHTFARHLIDRGVSVRDVSELLGHADLRHVWSYTSPDDAALRRAVELLP